MFADAGREGPLIVTTDRITTCARFGSIKLITKKDTAAILTYKEEQGFQYRQTGGISINAGQHILPNGLGHGPAQDPFVALQGFIDDVSHSLGTDIGRSAAQTPQPVRYSSCHRLVEAGNVGMEDCAVEKARDGRLGLFGALRLGHQALVQWVATCCSGLYHLRLAGAGHGRRYSSGGRG